MSMANLGEKASVGFFVANFFGFAPFLFYFLEICGGSTTAGPVHHTPLAGFTFSTCACQPPPSEIGRPTAVYYLPDIFDNTTSREAVPVRRQEISHTTADEAEL